MKNKAFEYMNNFLHQLGQLDPSEQKKLIAEARKRLRRVAKRLKEG